MNKISELIKVDWKSISNYGKFQRNHSIKYVDAWAILNCNLWTFAVHHNVLVKLCTRAIISRDRARLGLIAQFYVHTYLAENA